VWYQGYNVPSGPFMTTNADGTYTLTYDCLLPFAEMPLREFTLRVILPEAATVVSVDAPFPHNLSFTSRYTYLDGPFFGRPVATLKSSVPLLSSHTQYSGHVRVTFKVPPFALLYKPLYVIAAFFAVFLVFIIGKRVDMSLGGNKGIHASGGAKQHAE
jgi:hypothetical protein